MTQKWNWRAPHFTEMTVWEMITNAQNSYLFVRRMRIVFWINWFSMPDKMTLVTKYFTWKGSVSFIVWTCSNPFKSYSSGISYPCREDFSFPCLHFSRTHARPCGLTSPSQVDAVLTDKGHAPTDECVSVQSRINFQTSAEYWWAFLDLSAHKKNTLHIYNLKQLLLFQWVRCSFLAVQLQKQITTPSNKQLSR